MYHSDDEEPHLSATLYIPGEGALKSRSPGYLGGGTPSFEWSKSQSAEEFVDEIVKGMQREGRYQTGIIDGEVLFGNLRRTLDLAIRARRGDDPETPCLKGPLVEMYNDEWFVTSFGLECPSRAFAQPLDRATSEAIGPPDHISAEEWRFLVNYGRAILQTSGHLK
jgi:hypothetical protein